MSLRTAPSARSGRRPEASTGSRVSPAKAVGAGGVQAALEALRGGRMVIVSTRHLHHGGILMAAEHCRAEDVAFLRRHTSGVIGVALTATRASELGLPLMFGDAYSGRAMFTVSVDATNGTTTGVSASDRATTIRKLAEPGAVADDFSRPGHVFPVIAREGGVIARRGNTEAAIDLCRLAKLQSAAVLTSVTRSDGALATFSEIRRLARSWRLVVVDIEEIVTYRLAHEPAVRQEVPTKLTTAWGEATLHAYRVQTGGTQLVVVHGKPRSGAACLLAFHEECVLGHALRSQGCRCGLWLERDMQRIIASDLGAVVYTPETGNVLHGIGRLRGRSAEVYPSSHPSDRINRDDRERRQHAVAAQVLAHIGVHRVELLRPNRAAQAALELSGIEVVTRRGGRRARRSRERPVAQPARARLAARSSAETAIGS